MKVEDKGQGGPFSVEFVGGANAFGGDDILIENPYEEMGYTAPRSVVDRAGSESIQEMARKLRGFFFGLAINSSHSSLSFLGIFFFWC